MYTELKDTDFQHYEEKEYPGENGITAHLHWGFNRLSRRLKNNSSCYELHAPIPGFIFLVGLKKKMTGCMCLKILFIPPVCCLQRISTVKIFFKK